LTVSYHRLSGVLVAEEPLHVGSGVRTGVIKRSLMYVPGSVVRGSCGVALVKSLCKLKEPRVDHENCEHRDGCEYAGLFGEGREDAGLFFRYGYPLHLKCGGTYRPVSKLLYMCENSQCGKTYRALDPPKQCSCNGRVKPLTGYVCDTCGEVCSSPVGLRRITSTAVTRDTLTAATVPGPDGDKGTLHTLESIAGDPPPRFRFEVVAGARMDGALKTLCSVAEHGIPYEGLGGSRSRGYGKVSLINLRVEEVTMEALLKRAEEIDPGLFAVEALSPLLVEGEMTSSALLEGARRAYSWAFREGKPALPDVKLEAARASVEGFGGWSLKDARPRRTEYGYSAGSVFVFRCGGDSGLLSRALAALEVYPLGGRKPHGCGQLRVIRPPEGVKEE
jgi:hypothetical protein